MGATNRTGMLPDDSKGAITDPSEDLPLTAVVRRRVKRGSEDAFEAAIQAFITFAFAFPGHLDIHVLRPDLKHSRDYTVVHRFADAGAREAFKASAAYQEWMGRFRELTEGDPYIEEHGGMAGWFTLPAQPCASPPPRHKMAVVTFLGVYPLTSVLPQLFRELLPTWHPLLLNVVVTAMGVATLTWLVMPFLTRRLARWLFPTSE